MKDTFEFNVQFIKTIENNPCLWDHDRKDYSIRDIQERTWLQIAKQVNEPVNDCKDRWKNIRGRYLKFLKQRIFPGPKRCKDYYLAEYLPFLDRFYKPKRPKNLSLDDSDMSSYSEDRPYDEGLQLSDGQEDADDGTQHTLNNHEITLSPSALCNIKLEPNLEQNLEQNICQSTEYYVATAEKRPNTSDANGEEKAEEPKKKKKRNRVDDPNLSFLKSILPDMKKMNPQQLRNFKIGIISLCSTVLDSTFEINIQK